MTICTNHAAIEILGQAVEQLQAIGVDCLISPIKLPQGNALGLYLSDTVKGVVAADLAMRRGVEVAHTAAGAREFAKDVTAALSDVEAQDPVHVAPPEFERRSEANPTGGNSSQGER